MRFGKNKILIDLTKTEVTGTRSKKVSKAPESRHRSQFVTLEYLKLTSPDISFLRLSSVIEKSSKMLFPDFSNDKVLEVSSLMCIHILKEGKN